MVQCSWALFTAVKSKSGKRGFLDHLRVYVRGGSGGHGLVKYGGHGGSGGNVYVVAHANASLKRLVDVNPEKRFTASAGSPSSVRCLLGADGTDIEIKVPTGICIANDAGRLLGEVNQPGDKILVAKGGKGGNASNNYTGQRGHGYSIRLDLKLIADIGFVGFPNAGKSTLLSALSRATPKIASYPFTTLRPQIGVMQYADLRQITLADLPGLIEGAHLNVGLGFRFLKHVERTKLLLFVVDIRGFRLSSQAPLRSAVENIILLNKELEMYKEELLNKPAVLVLNKIDLPDSAALVDDIKNKVTNLKDNLHEVEPQFRPNQLVRFDEIIAVSAKQRTGTDYLKERLRQWLDVNADINLAAEQNERQLQLATSTTNELSEHLPGPKLV